MPLCMALRQRKSETNDHNLQCHSARPCGNAKVRVENTVRHFPDGRKHTNCRMQTASVDSSSTESNSPPRCPALQGKVTHTSAPIRPSDDQGSTSEQGLRSSSHT
eukprot:1161773-Pelagomonas_calceolata.AAC.4